MKKIMVKSNYHVIRHHAFLYHETSDDIYVINFVQKKWLDVMKEQILLNEDQMKKYDKTSFYYTISSESTFRTLDDIEDWIFVFPIKKYWKQFELVSLFFEVFFFSKVSIVKKLEYAVARVERLISKNLLKNLILFVTDHYSTEKERLSFLFSEKVQTYLSL